MPKNNRVKKDLKAYNLRINQQDYEQIQQSAEKKNIPMNTLLQMIVADFLQEKKITNTEELVLDKIKSLPLKKRKALIKNLSSCDN